MNSIKKRLLSSVLILSVLIVLSFYVIGDMLGSASVVSFGGTYESSTNNSLIGSDSKMFNLTITYGDLSAVEENITRFNISLGTVANFTNFNFVNTTGDIEVNSTADGLGMPLWTSRVTYWADGSDAGWYCINDTLTTFSCNTSEEGPSSTTLNNGMNTSIKVLFNLSAASSVENTISWDILTWPIGSGAPNGTNVTVYIDTLAPRLFEVNLSDGNTTIMNDTFTDYGLNGVYLDYVDLTLTARLEELDVDAMWLYFQNNDSANATSYVNTYKVKMSDDGMNIFTTTIPTTQFTDNNMSSFVFVANDTEGNIIYLNNTDVSAESPHSFFINSSDVIRVGKVEVNDSYTANHSLSGTGLNDASADYLVAGNVIISAEVLGLNKDDANTYIVWNNSGSPLYSGALGQFDSNFQEYVEMTNITGANNTDLTSIATFVYTVPLTGNDTNKFVFYIVSNNSGDNYTAVVGPFNFTIDGETPSSPQITLTSPAGATSIDTSSSATYTCSATDSGSGGVTYSWLLTKPDGTTVTKTGSSATFTDTDTNQAGTHTVQCTAEDAVGYTSTSSTTLSAVYASGGGGGGGGGGGAAVGPSFDVDLSAEDSGTISAKQGFVKTFTFDGVTKHTVSFKIVDTENNKVTLKISSTPVEVTLGVSESREVDVNADSINDLRVTLDEIKGGKAEITIKKMEAGADIVAREDRKAAGLEEEVGVEPVEEVTSVEEGMGLGSIALIIAVILIIVGVGYYFMKKK